MDQRTSDGEMIPFDIAFVTADRKRGTGGEIIEMKNVVTTGHKQAKRLRTINPVGTEQFRSVHIDLILKVNGMNIV